MYFLKDISVVIPTYNRADDLKETLSSILPYLKSIKEIIIVDQSKNKKTKKLINKFRIKKLKYIYSSKPAITIARNKGFRAVAKSSRLICFIDDDVILGENYFEEIIRIFNEENNAKAVAAYIPQDKPSILSNIQNQFRKLFYLSYADEGANIISAYGNTYPLNLSKIIPAQWLPGVNMVYKKEVLAKNKFDENLLGYTLAEDIDFSYRLFMKHPSSIYITPFAKIYHRVSKKERYPTRRMSYINQIDHFYFNIKNLNKTIKQKIIFAWSILGISILRPINVIINPKKENLLKMIFFYESLFYCLTHLDDIRNGRLRDFKLTD